MDKNLGERQAELVTALAGELATVVGALLGGIAAAAPATGEVAPGWVVTCAMTGASAGRLTLAVGEQDAVTLARRLMGMNDDPPEEAVADTVAEVAGQAAGGLGQQPVAGGARIRVDGAPSRRGERPAHTPLVFDITLDDGTVFRFGCWARLEDAEAAAEQASSPVQAAAHTTPAKSGSHAEAAAAAPDNLDIILDIELPLTVRFGRTEMTLQSLTRVGPGSVIDLDRSPDEPVEVLINDKVIARGEVVVVAGNYGVRITEVASAVDRIRTMAT
jgi:flagellar motor switch protein FliN